MITAANMANIPGWTRIYSGKVRDLYVPAGFSKPSGMETLLVVASDRISAYGYVLPSVIKNKGIVLTHLSRWRPSQIDGQVPHHLLQILPPAEVANRAMVVQRLWMYRFECTVRGYLTGQYYREYKESGAVAGQRIPSGIKEAEQLPTPIFCPSTKALDGRHDVDITPATMSELMGAELVEKVRDYSLQLYNQAHKIALSRGVILADTKFEFGASINQGEEQVILGDEVLTPDSSRYWLVDDYEPGRPQPSFDKQIIRDWLMNDAGGWSFQSTAPPPLPAAVAKDIQEKYLQVAKILTGKSGLEK